MQKDAAVLEIQEVLGGVSISSLRLEALILKGVPGRQAPTESTRWLRF